MISHRVIFLIQLSFLHSFPVIKSVQIVDEEHTEAHYHRDIRGIGKARRRPENALNRRNTVLNQMYKYDYINEQVCDSLKALPIELKYQSVDHKQGLAPYFREYLRQILTAKEPKKNNYSEWNMVQYEIDKRQWEENPLYGFCNKNHKPDGTPYDLYQDGLRVYTTIDSRMQQYAEEAVNEHMQDLPKTFFREKRKKS